MNADRNVLDLLALPNKGAILFYPEMCNIHLCSPKGLLNDRSPISKQVQKIVWILLVYSLSVPFVWAISLSKCSHLSRKKVAVPAFLSFCHPFPSWWSWPVVAPWCTTHVLIWTLWCTLLDFPCTSVACSTMKASLKFMYVCTGGVIFTLTEKWRHPDSLKDFWVILVIPWSLLPLLLFLVRPGPLETSWRLNDFETKGMISVCIYIYVQRQKSRWWLTGMYWKVWDLGMP